MVTADLLDKLHPGASGVIDAAPVVRPDRVAAPIQPRNRFHSADQQHEFPA
jgi:hypothetical protein